MHPLLKRLALTGIVALAAGCGAPPDRPADPARATPASAAVPANATFKLEAWADNWFAAYLGETLIGEDAVPFATERSFNAETIFFEGEYPLQINIIARDYRENDTGLEYIGRSNQQLGDGGFIAQITDLRLGKVVAVTDGSWKALVIHQAPLDAACADEAQPAAGQGACAFAAPPEPDGWKTPGFDAGSWLPATVHSADAVRPKDGYDEIAWDARAKLIWGPDLKVDNTILYRLTVESP